MSFRFGAFSGASSTGGTSSSSTGGGGLYAGISLGGPAPAKKTADESTEEQPAEPAVSNSIPDPIRTGAIEDQNERPADDNGSKDDTKKDDDKSKASSWSSSLRFAPVIRKQPAKSATKPFAVPFVSTASVTSKPPNLAATAFAPDDDQESTTNNASGRTFHIPGRAKAALNAPTLANPTSKAPSVFARKGGFLAAHAPERIPGNLSAPSGSAVVSSTLSTSEKVDSSIPGFKHSLPAMLAQTSTLKGLVPSTTSSFSTKVLKKKLDQPPPLTLPDDEFGTGGGGDVNGFAQSEAGRKLALRAARNSKKSKKKGKTREVDPAILFMEDYDPARPNDYNEWINFVKRRRELQREALRLERQRQQRLEREEMSESSYYSSDEDGSVSDGNRPVNQGNFFAPPQEYHDPIPPHEVDKTTSLVAQAPVVVRAETGDEAYARRVALSQGIPYQPPQPVPPSEVGMMENFNDSGTAEGAPSTGTAPIVSVADAQARARIIAERLQKLKDSNRETPSTSPVSNAPEATLPTAPNPATTLLEAQAKARSIAAKLAALNGLNSSCPSTTSNPEGLQQPDQLPSNNTPTESTSKAPGQPDFARRLMDKYGWKEGQGLGANESGRTSILTVAAAAAAPGGNKKRKDNPGEAGIAGPMAPHKISSMGKGRGVVIDESRTQRDLEEKIRFGEPTRIVYLTNVVAVDEVDDELATEIAEEARKHGIVERCFVRIVQSGDVVDASEKVRVFILYSGLVGAWKAVKSFDGRFFGGRNIRARFFPENSFTLGDWDA